MVRQFVTNEETFVKILATSEATRYGILQAYNDCGLPRLETMKGSAIHKEAAAQARMWFPEADNNFLGKITRIVMALISVGNNQAT